jgi:hypothetical protein
MKLVEKIAKRSDGARPFFTFEFFPPKTEEVALSDLSHPPQCTLIAFGV